MHTRLITRRPGCGLGALLLALMGAGLFAAPAQAAGTLDNLQAAFNGESNARAKYLAFAQKADAEGYGQVASLFRAAAKAEGIHAAAHAAAIKALGGTAQADIKPVDVKSTRQNLEAAIAGETYERDTMYPSFLKMAQAENSSKAAKSFKYALAAEAEHAKLYAEALKNLDQLKGSSRKTYYVCPTCGFTTADLKFTDCPTCSERKEDFEKVD